MSVIPNRIAHHSMLRSPLVRHAVSNVPQLPEKLRSQTVIQKLN